MLKAMMLGSALVLTTTACTSMMGDNDRPMTGATATPTNAAAYVPTAAASDLFEIQSSQVALQRSQNADVRRFAQMMIDHHTRTTQQLTAAARAAGMTPPTPQLTPMQRDMIAQLQTQSGAAFDRTYLTQQVQAHEMALALHGTYAARGDRPALRTAAAAAAPIVRQHLEEARRMHRVMT